MQWHCGKCGKQLLPASGCELAEAANHAREAGHKPAVLVTPEAWRDYESSERQRAARLAKYRPTVPPGWPGVTTPEPSTVPQKTASTYWRPGRIVAVAISLALLSVSFCMWWSSRGAWSWCYHNVPVIDYNLPMEGGSGRTCRDIKDSRGGAMAVGMSGGMLLMLGIAFNAGRRPE